MSYLGWYRLLGSMLDDMSRYDWFGLDGIGGLMGIVIDEEGIDDSV